MSTLPNLLIVDDSDVNLFLLSKVINKIPVNLISAQSGSEALEKTDGVELALAIIDVRMPQMDGFELAMKMNNQRTTDKVPVIFLTANNINETEVFRGYNSGAVDYIQKPFSNHILLSKINVFLDLFNQKQLLIDNAAQLKTAAEELTRVNVSLKKSEEKYRSYIDYAPKGVFIADEDGKFLEVNNTLCNTTGFSEYELLKMAIPDLIPDRSSKESLDFINSVVKTGASRAESTFRDKYGITRWWTLSTVKLSETRLLGFTEEITDRKKMEEDLHSYQIKLEMQNEELTRAKNKAEDSTRKYAELYDFAPTGYLTLSADQTILELNHSAAGLLGKERSLLIGKPFGFFVSAYTRPDLNNFFLKMQQSKIKETVEVTIEAVDIQIKHVHIEGVFAGDNRQYIVNMVDLTDRKRTEENLRQSNIFLDSVVENIPHMIFIKDAMTLQFVKFNRAGENLLGISRENILGKTDYDLFSQEQADDFVAKDREVLSRKEMLEINEVLLTTRQQKKRILHTKKVPILNTQGEPEYLLGISEDVTELKETENSLKLSEEKYRTMVNASPDGILLIDMNGIIREVSEIGLELLGTDKKEDLLGRYFYHFVPAAEKSAIREIFEKTMNEGICQNIELRIKKKNNIDFLSEVSSTLIQDAHGQPLSVMIDIRDISFRKKMETKQIHADRMANLGEMASGIAHEINQPLNIISMVLDKILYETAKTQTVDVEFLKSKSDKIFENIIRIRNIIDHVRAFSRSHDDFIPTAFDINRSIENAVSMIGEQFKHLGINLILSLDRQISQMVGNTFKFEQVIINLLINAKDAVIDKKSKLEEFQDMMVGIKTWQENNFLIVKLTDNGIGIPNEDLHNIMLPFYTTKEEGKGTGLGLAICYQIIREMGGTIDITSDILGGTKIKLMMGLQRGK